MIYDCVQFPRRGRVHRTEVPGPSGTPEWLTLPLAQQPRETLIRDLAFAAGDRDALDERLDRLGWIRSAAAPAAREVRGYLFGELGSVIDFLDRGLRLCSSLLGIDVLITRSSALGIDRSLRGQERVLAIVQALRATVYLNAPGGRELYQPGAFRESDIELRFLAPYEGEHWHMLHALMTVDAASIRAEIDTPQAPPER